MTPLILTSLFAALACVSNLPAYAQQKAADDHAAHGKAAPAATAMTEGEVRRIDKGAGKITLKHGEIKNLDMSPMTMVFQVKDPAVLNRLKTGDKVKFRAENRNGALTVTEIETTR